MNTLRAWVRQPTTVAGISTLLGTACALLLHQVDSEQALPLLVGACCSMLLPDDATARADAQALAREAVIALKHGETR